MWLVAGVAVVALVAVGSVLLGGPGKSPGATRGGSAACMALSGARCLP